MRYKVKREKRRKGGWRERERERLEKMSKAFLSIQSP